MQQVTKLFYRRITPPSAAGGARPCVCRGRPPAEGVNALTAFIGGRRRGIARRGLGCLQLNTWPYAKMSRATHFVGTAGLPQ